MINIDSLYKSVQHFANKEQRGFISPSQFNDFVNRAVMESFMQKSQVFQSTQKISDDLRPFIKRVPLDVNSEGQVLYPEDYVHLSSIKYVKVTQVGKQTIKKPIELFPLDDNELGYRLNSRIVEPTKDYPVMVYYDGFIQVYPIDLQRVEITYLRKPVEAVWAFTIVNGRPAYDAANSVDVEFPFEVYNELMVKILSYVGINLREAALVQYAETKNQQGI
jgi:hypothetical protein